MATRTGPLCSTGGGGASALGRERCTRRKPKGGARWGEPRAGQVAITGRTAWLLLPRKDLHFGSSVFGLGGGRSLGVQLWLLVIGSAGDRPPKLTRKPHPLRFAHSITTPFAPLASGFSIVDHYRLDRRLGRPRSRPGRFEFKRVVLLLSGCDLSAGYSVRANNSPQLSTPQLVQTPAQLGLPSLGNSIRFSLGPCRAY